MSRFVEKETEADLRAELERNKIEVTNLREQLLKSTIDQSLKYNKKKVRYWVTNQIILSKLQADNSELDEELTFLTNQQKFNEEQNALLERKVQEMYAGSLKS